MKTKHLRWILGGNSIDVFSIFWNIDSIWWHWWDFIFKFVIFDQTFDRGLLESVFVTKDTLFNVKVAISIEKFSVQIIGNSSTILHFTNHIFEHISVNWKTAWSIGLLARLQVRNIFFNKSQWSLEIGVVKLVRDTPT